MIQTKIFKHIHPDTLEYLINKFLEEEQKKYVYFHLISSHLSVDTGSIVCQLYFDRNDSSFLPSHDEIVAYMDNDVVDTEADHEEDEVYGDY